MGAQGLWQVEGLTTSKAAGVRIAYASDPTLASYRVVRNERGEIVLLTLYAKSALDNIPGHILKEIRHAIESRTPD